MANECLIALGSVPRSGRVWAIETIGSTSWHFVPSHALDHRWSRVGEAEMAQIEVRSLHALLDISAAMFVLSTPFCM